MAIRFSFSSWLLSLATTSVSPLVVPPSAESAQQWSQNTALFKISDVASTWTQATANSEWGACNSNSSVVFDNKTMVMGGETSAAVKNDVRYSSDGVIRTWAGAAVGWSGRGSHTALVFNNKMWMFGGGGNKNDVWYSGNRIVWTNTLACLWQCAIALFSAITLRLAILVVCLFFRLIWNQNSVSARFSQHEQTSLASVTATRGIYPKRNTRRRTSTCPRYFHCGHSLAFIFLLFTCASSQRMTAPFLSSVDSPQHTSRALVGTSG
jgi:hypothetical protein